ncbi:hypothetical protein SDJN03_07188, partial [Cucurbita argyrosperma subsp. sororia]
MIFFFFSTEDHRPHFFYSQNQLNFFSAFVPPNFTEDDKVLRFSLILRHFSFTSVLYASLSADFPLNALNYLYHRAFLLLFLEREKAGQSYVNLRLIISFVIVQTYSPILS